MSKKQFPVEELRALLDYDADTGVFRWKVARGMTIKPGDVSGGKHNLGYVTVRLGGKNFFAHRVAWAHHYGEWPSMDIDHINGNRADNRIENLRVVSHAHNMQNRRRAPRQSLSGYLGVWTAGNRYRAGIEVDGVVKRLGYFDTPQAAHEAYVAAKRRLHTACTL